MKQRSDDETPGLFESSQPHKVIAGLVAIPAT